MHAWGLELQNRELSTPNAIFAGEQGRLAGILKNSIESRKQRGHVARQGQGYGRASGCNGSFKVQKTYTPHPKTSRCKSQILLSKP